MGAHGSSLYGLPTLMQKDAFGKTRQHLIISDDKVVCLKTTKTRLQNILTNSNTPPA